MRIVLRSAPASSALSPAHGLALDGILLRALEITPPRQTLVRPWDSTEALIRSFPEQPTAVLSFGGAAAREVLGSSSR